MLKKIIIIFSLLSPVTATYGMEIHGSIPVRVEVSIPPHVLIELAGFIGCLKSLELYGKGKELLAFHHPDEATQKAKNAEGAILIKDSNLLLLASAAAIIHTYFLNYFIQK